MGSVPVERIRKTPLVLQGMFLEILRSHFTHGSSPQFKWDPDISATKIVIAPIHNLDFDIVQQRPAVYVSRGGIQYSQESLGFDDVNFVDATTGTIGQQILVNCAVQLIPVDRRAAAVERLAEEISEVFLVFKSLIREDYSFMRFDVAGIAPVGYVQEDREYFTAPVTVATQFAEAWQLKQLSPKLRRVMLDVRSALGDPRGDAGLPAALGRAFSGKPVTEDSCDAESKFCTLPPEDLRGAPTLEPPPDTVDPGYGKGAYGD